MSLYIAKNRKVRGWHRRIKQVEAWKNANISLTMANFDRWEDISVLDIPWVYGTPHTHPLWIRLIIIKALLEIYAGWENSLKTAGEPYYIALRIYEARFYYSQVVAAQGDSIKNRKNDLGTEYETKPVAADYLEVLGNISDMRTYPDNIYHDGEWDGLSQKEITRIEKRPHEKIKQHSRMDGSIYYDYWERVGDVWVMENRLRYSQ